VIDRKPKKIVFELQGEKLRGKYTILQFGKEEKNWLLFKAKAG
jgi:hypothetical protein